MKNKLYSPTQAALAAFLGGPFTAIYVVQKNFQEMGDKASQQSTMRWGALLTVALLATISFLPATSGTTFGVGYAVAVRHIVIQRQLTKEQIERSELYEFESNWAVAGIAVLGVVSFLALVLPVAMLLAFFGIIE